MSPVEMTFLLLIALISFKAISITIQDEKEEARQRAVYRASPSVVASSAPKTYSPTSYSYGSSINPRHVRKPVRKPIFTVRRKPSVSYSKPTSQQRAA